jgi:uncharacterized protein YmfQ (DUF2313 family)
MAVSASEYVGMLKELLPHGVAWPRGDSTSLYALMFEVWGAELARVDARARVLITEDDPRFAIETFQEWLDEWGLPDDCIRAWSDANDSTLRKLLLWKIQTVGSQNWQFFVDLAAMFGYVITIDEFNRHSVRSRTSDVLSEEMWPHTWRVNVLAAQGSAMTYHQVTGDAKEPLAWWGDSLIECLIRRYAPAHCTLIFAYHDYK